MNNVDERLLAWEAGVFEAHGAIVDQNPASGDGYILLPEPLAKHMQLPDLISFGKDVDNPLAPNLASDFLDRLAPLLQNSPSIGLVELPQAYLKASSMVEPVAKAFTWLNARVQVRDTCATRIPYFTYYFALRIQSDDQFEAVLLVCLNGATGATVSHFDVMDHSDLIPAQDVNPDVATAARALLPTALVNAGYHAEVTSSAYVGRLEQRLQRDRDRLSSYYEALLREDSDRQRRSPQHTPEILEQRKLAVDMELKRKLHELHERYAMRVQLRPIALAIADMPALRVRCEVSRKNAKRDLDVYWHCLHKDIEGLRCHDCQRSSYSIAFTDNTVLPLCHACVAAGKKN